MKIKRVGCPVLSKWKKCFNKEEIINFEMLGEISGGPNINIELAMGGGPLVTFIKAYLVEWWAWMPVRKAMRK